jgi:diaminohydroxyphosphoribosylaminopyrimidine deaminase/5-amino-6-(5-phosphoribosylamino)uracil reductase
VDGDHLSLRDALTKIADKGITRVFCEGGGKLASSLIRQGLVDRMITFTAGVSIGSDGIPNLGALGVNTLDQAPKFALEGHRRIGADLMAEWRPI